MKQFDVLSRDSDVLTHRLLEASAGTGKTFAIQHVVTRLVLNGIHLEKILMMTFTRAATRELKTRVRGALVSAYSELESQQSRFDYLSALIEEGDQSVKEALRRLDDALNLFDRSQIFTIHGFCYRMLQEHAFEAGVSFDLRDPEEGEHLRRSHEAICDFFRAKCKLPKYSASQVESVLNQHQGDLDRLIARLGKLIERRAEFAEYPSFEHSLSAFNENLTKAPTLNGEKLLQDLYRLAPHYKGVDMQLAEQQLLSLLDFLKKKRCSSSEFDALLGRDVWFLEKLHEKNLKKRAQLPSPSELFYPQAFTELSSLFLPVVQSAKAPLHTLMRMARDCKRDAHQLPALSFDDLLHQMKEALTSAEFCEKVRKRYDALIVDEFQDTDPIQWRIIQTLFLENVSLRCVYLVGDPKQSIYSFRGADVYTYLKAASLIKERSHLTTNFRSIAPLVQALNYLFSQGGGASWLLLPKQESNLDYVQVASAATSEDFDCGDAIHFFLIQGEKGREKSWPTKSMESQQFFPFIAQEIQTLYKNRRNFKQFAVLVKDRFQAERLRDFLKNCGIPCQTSRGKQLINSRGYLALLQFLQTLIDPGEVKLLFAGPLFGLSDEEIKNEEFSSAKGHLQDLSRAWKTQGFGAIVEEFLTFSWKGLTVLQRASRVERLCEEFRRASELLMQRESKGPASLEAHLIFLQGLKRRVKSHEEELTYHQTDGEDAVSLLTVHASKGLEFDVVFALGVSSRDTHLEDLIFVREETEERLEKLDMESPASRLYIREQNAEKMRQLYVALTRAKKRVYIPLALDRHSPGSDLAPIELFLSKQGTEQLSLETVVSFLQEARGRASIGYTLLQERISPLKMTFEKSMHQMAQKRSPILNRKVHTLSSFSGLVKTETAALDHEKESEEIFAPLPEELAGQNAHTLPAGAETGVLLHGILEKIFKKGLFFPHFQDKRRELIFKNLTCTPLEKWKEVVEQMVESVLRLPLLEDFCLEKLSKGKFVQEMEFLFPCGQKLLKGFADLLFEHGGKYYLIDWKSNWLGQSTEAYSLENLEEAMREHNYFLQGAIYACAFERYVKLFDKRPFEELFGGAFYLFLRGNGIYHFIPDRTLLQEYL